jgi:hypothetical protein
MAKEMVRVTRPGGKVAAYVWDYAHGMQMMQHFWDTAVELNPDDSRLDEAKRFPLCQPEPLKLLFQEAGLNSISVRSIVIPTVFRDFNDYWLPFLGKQGAAPTYLASLNEEMRERIRDALKARLVAATDGSIAMTARSWAVQGTVPPKGWVYESILLLGVSQNDYTESLFLLVGDRSLQSVLSANSIGYSGAARAQSSGPTLAL